jgi:hypothetical protein
MRCGRVNCIDFYIYIVHAVVFIILLIGVHSQTQHIIVDKPLYWQHVSAHNIVIFRPHTNVWTDHWLLRCTVMCCVWLYTSINNNCIELDQSAVQQLVCRNTVIKFRVCNNVALKRFSPDSLTDHQALSCTFYGSILPTQNCVIGLKIEAVTRALSSLLRKHCSQLGLGSASVKNF